ncbi:MAG: hypothetical protein WAM73_08545 [Desulfobacterales bacterium]
MWNSATAPGGVVRACFPAGVPRILCACFLPEIITGSGKLCRSITGVVSKRREKFRHVQEHLDIPSLRTGRWTGWIDI